MTQHIPSRQDQVSQEIRFTNAHPGVIDYVGGLYYFHQKIVGHPISIYGPQATYWLLPSGRPSNLLDGYGQDGTTDFHSDSMAIFGEATWHVTHRLALTGGLRETWETKHGTYNTNVSGGLATTTASLVNDKASILRAQYYTASVSEEACRRINLAWKARDLQFYVNGASGQSRAASTCRACRSIPPAWPAMPAATPFFPPPSSARNAISHGRRASKASG
jgi:iron complex outermembrane receptor protein